MARAINMPQVGQDIKTARILEWYVEVGQEVSEGDILATVESDKANFEVEAFESGTVLKLLFETGEEAEVFKPIAYIGAKGEQIPAELRQAGILTEDSLTPASSKSVLSADTTGAHSGPGHKKQISSPSARRIASEKGVKLEMISGTGPGGRVIKKDVEAFPAHSTGARKITPLAKRMADDIGLPHAELKGTGVSGKVVRSDILSQLDPRRSSTLIPGPDDRVREFSRTRKRIAERLSLSVQTIPHYYLFMDVDMTAAIEWRRSANEKGGHKISVNDILIKATVEALMEHPEMNALVDEEKMVIKPAVNMGVAVATDDGLLVPVIPHAEEKSIGEISRLSRKNADDARRGVINTTKPGTFTISNLGMHGVGSFLPIINPPECAILSAGKTDKKAIPHGDGVKFIESLTLGLACDHRAVDGERASRFLGTVKRNLEDFSNENKP